MHYQDERLSAHKSFGKIAHFLGMCDILALCPYNRFFQSQNIDFVWPKGLNNMLWQVNCCNFGSINLMQLYQ